MSTRTGTTAKARFVAALITAIGGSVEAQAHPSIGGDEAAARLEATVTEARQQREAGIETVRRAGLEAWRIHHGQQP